MFIVNNLTVCSTTTHVRHCLQVFELGTRVPLIIAAPHLTTSHGQKTTHLAELVDVSTLIMPQTAVGCVLTTPSNHGRYIPLLRH